MKILLIRPSSSQEELKKTSLCSHPINLLYLAAYIRKFGHEVQILDLEVEDMHGVDLNFHPDIIGITAMTPLINKAAEIAKEMKMLYQAIIIVGGNHVTSMPGETMKEFPIFDIGIVGEGEETLREICDGVSLQDVLGIVYREKDKVIVNQRRPPICSLDDLPFPARDLIDMKKYRGASSPGLSREFLTITEIYVNRGCNWGLCTFCASMKTHQKFRMRSIDNVIAEMKECIEKYKINHFTIDDDTFTTDKKRVMEFCEKVKPLNIKWDADTRVNNVDREMLQAMKNAGCKKLSFGVESGSQRILQLIKKGITIKQIKDAFNMCHEIGIETAAYFMVGAHPDETYEDVKETKKLIKEIKAGFITASIGVPYPGTELRQQMEERNLIFNNDWSNYLSYKIVPTWRTTNFSPEDLLRIQKEILNSFYMNPAYLVKRFFKIRSFGEFKYWINAFRGAKKVM